MPSPNRGSPSGEKTGTRSRASASSSASRQSGLSRPASRAIVSQRSAVGKEVANGLHRLVDLPVAVRQREEPGLELRWRQVDAACEQMPEETAEALEVAVLRVLEAARGRVAHEQRQHRTDS